MAVQKTGRSYVFKTTFIFFLLSVWMTLFYSANNYRVLQQGLRPLVRAVENKVVLHKTRDFKEMETDTFIFRYEGIDDEILELVKNTAEDKYKEITDIFQYEFKDKILVVIYNHMDLMMKTTMLKKGDPPVGVYYGNSVHILNPGLWAEEADELENIFYSEGPMLHELTHLFTDHIGNGNFPMWFTEGVSLYFEYMVDNYEWGREVIFTDADTYTMEELNNNFYGLDQYRAYTQSFRLVKNMADDHGLNKLIDIITLLGKGHDINEFIHLFEKI